MDQLLFNRVLAGFGALIGFLLNAVWQAVKDLQNSEKNMAAKVANIEVLVAGDYIKKNEFNENVKAIFAKLEKIEDKIDRKIDKQ